MMCRLCKSADKQILFAVDGYPLVRCGSCGFVYLDADFTADELAGFYKAEYFKGEDDYFDEQSRTYMAGGLLDDIRRFKQGGKLLEIGCACGYFLKLAKEYSFDVHGIEISGDAADFAKKLGLDINIGNIEDVTSSEKYDVIVMSNVLEHLKDPREALKKIVSWLSDDGILFLNVPNLNSIAVKLKHDHTIFTKVHLSYFTPDTLKCLCDECGLDVISFRSNLFAYILYCFSRLLYFDKKVVGVIKPSSLSSSKSFVSDIWHFIKACDRTKYGIDVQLICKHR
jgi:cyclopropane fatty-acyl-phospholipid synthase-like methyltransferase